MRGEILLSMLSVFAVMAGVQSSTSKGGWYNSWQEYFCTNWFTWPWFDAGEDFTTERIPQMRTIIGSCKADVGTCPFGTCNSKSYIELFYCPGDGFICPKTETRKVDCGVFGIHTYEYVASCGCCKDKGIVVMGTVVDSRTNAPLEYMMINVDEKYAVKSNANGEFTSNVKSTTTSVVITARDTKKKNVYLDAVKIVDLPLGFSGPIHVELFMVKKAKSIKFKAGKGVKLAISDNPLKPDKTVTAMVVISPNSFKNKKGKKYNGKVYASVTFIDTHSGPGSPIPGRFLTPDGNGAENLISDGIAAFDFRDKGGNELNVGPIKFMVRSGMRLWDLDINTGLWNPANAVETTRAKRQVGLTDEFLVTVTNGQWVNIDKIPGAPRCYFKGRIFEQISGDEITSSVTTTFKPEILAYIPADNQRLRMYAGYTSTPSDTCYEVRCPDISTDPNDLLVGFINMTATEYLSIGGIYVPYISYLIPGAFVNYDVPIQTSLTNVKYDIAPNGLDVFVNFLSNVAGVFYTDKAICESSTVSQPALHFFKPEPPSYVPVPADTDICTARIHFKDNWQFYNYTDTLAGLPFVTAVSLWQQGSTNFYFTDTAQMELSSVGGDDFIFACLKYRCSLVSELTTVYLDIDIPIVDITVDRNGTEITVTTQEFFCNGECVDSLCNTQGGTGGSVVTIDGSFLAPDSVASGPDFFNSEDNDCADKDVADPFAYVFSCNAKDMISR